MPNLIERRQKKREKQLESRLGIPVNLKTSLNAQVLIVADFKGIYDKETNEALLLIAQRFYDNPQLLDEDVFKPSFFNRYLGPSKTYRELCSDPSYARKIINLYHTEIEPELAGHKLVDHEITDNVLQFRRFEREDS